MNITAEEKLMYEAMKAIYDSGIPVSFKGSMVLKACLIEAGYSEEIRHTVDIDANWNSDTAPTAEQLVESLQKALTDNGIGLTVSLHRMYGERRSAGFELADSSSGEVLFTMGMDVNRPNPPKKIYEVAGIRFCGVAPIQMIADKVATISTGRVFRRIKDVVDLYYISKVFAFDSAAVMQTLKDDGRSLEKFDGFLRHPEELQHSYEKFRFTGDVSKPPFEEVYHTVKMYIRDVLPKERKRGQER